jgi:hypothetical protein
MNRRPPPQENLFKIDGIFLKKFKSFWEEDPYFPSNVSSNKIKFKN